MVAMPSQPRSTTPIAKPVLALTTGDPAGIGPEIVAAVLADPAMHELATLVVIGSPSTTVPHASSAAGGAASFAAVCEAIERAKLGPGRPGHVDAIVTAPISKESWHLAGHRYPGHTELLAERFASPRTAMLFVGPTLRVILVTVHCALRDVPRLLSTENVLNAITLGARSCRELGITSPRVAVCGLNPHAGEGGLFGDEDARVITPAIELARQRGLNVTGPHPGDAVFLAAAKGQHDLVVAMYHDQGLIPVKLIDREHAVNVSVGLECDGRPIVRTSPAHGTAFDIAGQNKADPSSMKAAVSLAAQMAAKNLMPMVDLKS